MSSVVISGNTSGTVTLFAPDVSGNTTLTLPTSNGTVSLTSSPSFTGNITMSTADAGIIFNKTGALVNSTLNDYETGTWTPNLIATSGSITAQTTTGTYIKVGRLVTVQLNITSITVGASTALSINNLPFTVNSTGSGTNGEGVTREDKATGFLWFLSTLPGTTSAALFRYDNSSAVTSSLGWNGTLTYIAAS